MIPLIVLSVLLTILVQARETSVRCWRLQDLTEFCDYRDVCYSQSEGLIIGKRGTEPYNRLEIINQGGINPYSHVVKEDYRNEGLLPWRAFIGGIAVNPDVIDDPKNTWFRANTSLLMAFDADVPNIFHTSEKILAGYGSLWFLNQLDSPVGDFDAVHLLRPERSLGNWEKEFITILFEQSAITGQLFYSEAMEQYRNRRLCFRRLVVPGTAIFFFGGPTQALETRTLVYRTALHSVVPVCDKKLLTIIQRKSTRRIVNLDDVVEMVVQPLGVPFQIVYLEELSFKEQVRVMAESRVLVAVHGAGLSNVMFMQPNAVVLELFAYNYVYHLYHNIATASGLFHIAYEAGRDETLYPGDIPLDRHSSYLCLSDGSCASSTKNSDVKLKMDKFAASLSFALSLVGPCH